MNKVIDQAYKEWLEVGLSTEPADFDKAEEAITYLYKSIGKDKPHFVRLPSPFAAQVYINVLSQLRGPLGEQFKDQLIGQLGGKLWNPSRNQLRDQIREELEDQLRDNLGNKLWGQLKDQLANNLRGQLREQIGEQLGAQLEDQLYDQLYDQLRSQELKFTPTYFLGSWDSIWMWLDAGRQLGVEYKKLKELEAHLDVCRSINLWYPFEDFVVLTDRPKNISLENGVLSNDKKAALEYRDGYKLYALDGVVVPATWIEEGFPPAEELLSWKNADQRAVACKYAGWHTVLEGLDAQIVDRAENPLHGTLFAFNFENRKCKCLVYICPSDPTGQRVMSSLVYPSCQTALEANAWMTRQTVEELLQLEGRA